MTGNITGNTGKNQESGGHLNSAVAPICYDDVAVDVHCYTGGGIELAVPLTVGPKLQ